MKIWILIKVLIKDPTSN